ncbi:eppin-like [Pteronotus mesoamericanus]|uniref:eppin-like n=1 Tax=Pteronotus mesoamericanus TaxID=1884717 RepID=UPI0023EAB047|nr:eppin-like [Pteronotus parnellii mesoamericanus]
MVSSGVLRILVLVILLVNVQGFTLSDLLSPKRCPRIQEKCEFRERNICKKNKNCPDNMKCCVFNCGKKCLDLNQDICSLPKDPGPCLALFHRWWYDKKNDTCASFIYGGCQGNNNNFQTKDLCLNMCSKKRVCPKTKIPCKIEEINQCSKRKPCPEDMKCCKFNCAKKCVTPKEGNTEIS